MFYTQMDVVDLSLVIKVVLSLRKNWVFFDIQVIKFPRVLSILLTRLGSKPNRETNDGINGISLRPEILDTFMKAR